MGTVRSQEEAETGGLEMIHTGKLIIVTILMLGTVFIITMMTVCGWQILKMIFGG